MVVACSYNSNVYFSGDAPDAPVDDAMAPAMDTGSTTDGADALRCTADLACTSNPGGPCVLGRTMCADPPRCVDDVAAPDGTTCGAGLCTLGGCLPPATISTSVDLSTTAVTPGRTCAEAPGYAVTSLPDRSTAAIVPDPVGDCLVAGDEIMIINLQGAPGVTTNIGNWELLRIAGVSGSTLTFTTARTRFYGATAEADDNIGTDAANQKVAIVRVPRLGAASIAAGARLTTAGWDGNKGGVLAIRTASLAVDGAIDMSTAGYRPGRWSQDRGCVINVTTESGESISGPPVASPVRNAGGAGGIAAAQGPSFNGNTPISATPGHATAGRSGINGNGRNLGEPGAVYGSPDASRLTLGSGSSGNLTCVTGGNPNGQLIGGGASGAGIVAVFAGDVAVSSTGAVVAAAVDAFRDVAASGGYVYVRATNVDLGATRVTAQGGTARGGSSGMTSPAGDGYVVVEASGTITGDSLPAASRP